MVWTLALSLVSEFGDLEARSGLGRLRHVIERLSLIRAAWLDAQFGSAQFGPLFGTRLDLAQDSTQGSAPRLSWGSILLGSVWYSELGSARVRWHRSVSWV